MTRGIRLMVAVAALVLLLGACGDDDDDGGGGGDGATTTEAAEGTTTTTIDPTAVRCDGTIDIAQCEAGTIDPREGLADGDTVTIEVGGFEPNTDVGITQCIDELDPDNGIEEVAGDGSDCNLRNLPTASVDAEGVVSTTFAVAGGQTMIDNTANGVTCDAEHDCLVSVGPLSADPEVPRATFPVSFA